MSRLARTKSIDALIAESEEPAQRLEKSLGPWSLTALGIGAVIGSGIFVITGTAAAGETLRVPSILHAPVLEILRYGTDVVSMGRPGAGPAIVLSFFLVAIACALSALCFAELASMIPIAGSTYTYAYATLGELVAWMIGWDLILEYAVGNMAVAVGFSAYFNALLDGLFGVSLPRAFSEPMIAGGEWTGSYFNLPALLVILALTFLLSRGIRESSRANAVMVVVKTCAILLFIGAASGAVNPANWRPFMPNGFPGVLTGAAIVFFAYIGFDAVSTAAEECKRPQRDLPFGLFMTLLVCTLLYAGAAAVLTGIAHYTTLNNPAPVANALRAIGYDSIRRLVSLGAVAGALSVLLVCQYGQTRIWFAMSRDGLLPRVFSKVHPARRTPYVSTWIAGFAVGIPAGIWDIGTLADLTNIGTLFAFMIVSAGVLALRRVQPDRARGFRVPFVPLTPILAIACCLALMLSLPLQTWIRFIAWMAIGLLIYFAYSRSRSRLGAST